MAAFIFPVRGRGKPGVMVRADLLAEAWRDIRQAIPGVDALMEGEPYRTDDTSEPARQVKLGEVLAHEWPPREPVDG